MEGLGYAVKRALTFDQLVDLSLAVKLASIVVHADEMLSPDGRELDRMVLKQAVSDPEVQKWIKKLGALAPLKRKP